MCSQRVSKDDLIGSGLTLGKYLQVSIISTVGVRNVLRHQALIMNIFHNN